MKFEDLIDEVAQMDIEKGWVDGQVGDIAKSIMIESAELLEHFQWDDTVRLRGEVPEKNKTEIGKEMADILIYLIKMGKRLDIDLIQAAHNKVAEVKSR